MPYAYDTLSGYLEGLKIVITCKFGQICDIKESSQNQSRNFAAWLNVERIIRSDSSGSTSQHAAQVSLTWRKTFNGQPGD